ncbi:MAG: hypothetical protein JXQ73_02880 [Phycisphaerae bacterium]|nr:hypothetical protein [Phycisphaerae bacterium]
MLSNQLRLPDRRRWLIRGVSIAVLAIGALVLFSLPSEAIRTLLVFEIRQDMDQILFSDFGEPAQFAVWLEDPETSRPRTVAVARRSARGEWKGKVECPAALPCWFEVYRKESGRTGLPTPNTPAPDAVTQATPNAPEFACAAEVPPHSRWICWVEVNMSADFNEAFPQLNETTGEMDTDHAGQPSLLYRGEIVADVGQEISLALYGRTVIGTRTGEISQDLNGITTARDVFRSIRVRVVTPPTQHRH